MPIVSVLGCDVHYVERGAPAETARHTLVALHGFPTDHRSALANFEPAFAARPHWRRLYPDLPGLGRTLAPAWVGSTDDVFRVVTAFVEALVPGEFAIAGASYGGYLAAGLTAAWPRRVTGVALIVPMVSTHDRRDVAPHEVRRREPGLDASEVFAETAVMMTAETARRTRDEIEAALAAADPEAVARIGANYGGSFPLQPLGGVYERPGLVVVGRQDAVLGFNDQWTAYGRWPRTTFAALDRGGHGLYLELPALVDPLVDDWVDRVETF